jgi:2',3'-cyclic-nucleotide 2'-phosphodiesterase (5'-nucleotidase family)
MVYQNTYKGRISSAARRIALFLSIGSLFIFSSCRSRMNVNHSEKVLYPISAEQPKDSAILAYYLPYKANLDSQMNKVIARSAIEIVKGRPEGPLNNLMADAMFSTGRLNKIPFDVAYTNYGGLRIGLPKGNITLNNVFELMPFENLITTVTFSGKNMQQFFDYVAEAGGDPIAGAKFRIKDKKAVDVMIGGQRLDVSKNYVLLTSDYMANGGDGGEIFSKATDRKTFEIKLRDALLNYMELQTKEGKILNPINDGRISVE